MALLSNGSIKCDYCGKFIPIDDLAAGDAIHQCILPDSEFSVETFESQCKSCLAKERA